MPAYTPTGPFVNGGAPGLAAAFFNNLETWIQQAEGATGSSSISGATSGTATLYQNLQGSVKMVVVQLTNFRNGGGTAQTIAIPVPFTKSASTKTGDFPSYQLLASGVAKTVNIITNIAGAGGGTATGTTTPGQYSIGEINVAFDTISFPTDSSTRNGNLVLIGV